MHAARAKLLVALVGVIATTGCASNARDPLSSP